jgi:hypothetical protein
MHAKTLAQPRICPEQSLCFTTCLTWPCSVPQLWWPGIGSRECFCITLSACYFWHADNHLNGSIDASLKLPNTLEVLSLGGNRLSSSLPEGLALSKLEKLQHLNLSSNELTGSLPSWTFPRTLSELLLNNNRFSGGIAGRWAAAVGSQLTLVGLAGNQLTALSPDWQPPNSSVALHLENNSLAGEVGGEGLDCWLRL